jgi:hypothetical protein
MQRLGSASVNFVSFNNNNNNNNWFIFRSDKEQSKKHQAILIKAQRGPASFSYFYNSLV